MSLLEVEGLTRTFGGIVAVDGASFAVEESEILGLAGPNGAGKTVTFDCITGQLSPDAGTVTFRGQDITRFAPDAIARAGIGRTFQDVRVYPELSVRENLVFAAQAKGIGATAGAAVTGASGDEDRDIEARTADILETVELDHLAEDDAESLSYGQRKILAFAAALMTHPEPELILLDEPMAGVNPTMINKLTEYVDTFNERGRSFLLVEHNMRVMSEVCDRIVVLHAGQPIAVGEPAEIRNDEQVIEAYFGGGS